ncbi:MAG: translation initiation factor IF-2 subunit beta [Candidatus Woesearchaeota archaeon]
MEYENLLERGMSELPESAIQKSRFEIPKVKGHIEGNKTVVSNFGQIAGTLGRDLNHMIKYLLKELATPGDMRGSLLIFKTKVPASKINEKIRKYAAEFVLCPQCGKPDTKLEKEKNLTYLKCMACGAKHPVKSIT